MDLEPALQQLVLAAVALMGGSARRKYMACVVRFLGRGGQRLAEKLLGFDRATVRKGESELRLGTEIADGRAGKRSGILDRLTSLEQDIRDVVDCWSQTDPRFKTTKRYSKLTVLEVVKRLIDDKGYDDRDLPSNETIRKLMHKFGYKLQRVRKVKPKKKIAQTDAIFHQIHTVHAEAAASSDTLRMCMDAKATVKIGELCRGGMSWVAVKALDHDFKPDALLTPIDILLVEHDELHLYFVQGPVTADTYADVLSHFWQTNKSRFSGISRLLVDQDNGPEVNSRRTQYMSRLVEFVDDNKVSLSLAYYPPYHSKYNPAERPWANLEKAWNGTLLDSVDAAVGHGRSMKWKGEHPTVIEWLHKTYQKGVTLTKQAMAAVEARLERLPGLEKWFVDIVPTVA